MQLLSILPCHRTERDEEVDDGCKEVLCRVGEELIRATASSLSCSLIQGSKQCGGSLRCSTQVRDVLLLDRVYPVGVLHIREVDDVKLHVFRDIPEHLVLVEMIESHSCKRRKLIIIQD